MKKLTTALTVGAIFLAPSLALAASVQLSPLTENVAAGQSFNVTLTAVPSGSPLYTVSANLSFNPTILEVTGFTLGSSWIAVTQNGYDLIDNTNGSLIKTGGLPGGFNNAMTLGTVTFRAKQAGNATISVNGNSVMLDGGSNNELSGTQGTVAITVTNAPATTRNTTQTTNTGSAANGTGTTNGTTTTGTTGNANQAAAAALTASGTSQTAAAANAFGNVPQWVWWLILAIVVIGGGYWIWRQYGSTKA